MGRTRLNAIDIIIVIILVAQGAAGFRRGLALALASVSGAVGGLILGYRCAQPLALKADQLWGVTTHLTAFLARYMKAVIPASAALPKNATPAMIEQALRAETIPTPLRDYLTLHLADFLAHCSRAESAVDIIARALAGLLVTAAIFGLLFLVCRTLTYAVGVWLTSLAARTPLNLPNHFGGALFGLLEGLLGVTLLVGVLTTLLTFLPDSNVVAKAWSTSGLVKLFAKAFYALLPSAPAVLPKVP